MRETLLPKKLALPVFCSDPPNAYATEEILPMLSVGGLLTLLPDPVDCGGGCGLAGCGGGVVPADVPRVPERGAR